MMSLGQRWHRDLPVGRAAVSRIQALVICSITWLWFLEHSLMSLTQFGTLCYKCGSYVLYGCWLTCSATLADAWRIRFATARSISWLSWSSSSISDAGCVCALCLRLCCAEWFLSTTLTSCRIINYEIEELHLWGHFLHISGASGAH